ncbi:hypothetical protein VPH166E361_0107 [Vibrio phage 166E36-1]
MGEMADFALEQVCTIEALRDDYVGGDMSMHEAYEHGFLNETGCEQDGVQAAWDRKGIPTREYVDNELSHAMKDLELSTNVGNGFRGHDKCSNTHTPEITTKHLKTIEFLYGFASHYLKYSKLSQKQMNIISTNFPSHEGTGMCSVENFCYHVDRKDLTSKLKQLLDNHTIVDEY